MKVVGLCCYQADISDACRELREDKGAIEVAISGAERALEEAMEGWPQGEGHKFHVLVTVEK